VATMYPERKREEFRKSEAEWHFYRACREQLPDHVVVFHGGRYLLRDPERWDEDGEIDFLVVDPNRGFMVVEVKGGRIRLEGDRWYSTDRHGRQHRIDDPFRQAEARKHGLIRKLKRAGVRTNKLRFCHAVCFPDCEVTADLTAYALRDAVIDARDMLELTAAIERCFGGPRARGHVSPEVIDRVRELFFPSQEVPRARLGVVIERGKREMARLTDDQRWVLETMRSNHRVLVTGSAGSGKTFLALEQARRLARAGYSVLVTCYNRPLASWMRRYLRNNAGLTRSEVRRITVRNYHDLARWYALQAGIPLFEPRLKETQRRRIDRYVKGFFDRYYNEYYPRVLNRSLEIVPHRFDALIVDEGQDVRTAWWDVLFGVVAYPERSPVYVFMDDNRILPRSGLPDILTTFTRQSLTKNIRNARPIYELAMSYYQGLFPVESGGLDGSPVEFVPFTFSYEEDAKPYGWAGMYAHDQKLRAVLDSIVHRLVSEQGVAPEDITVLTPVSAHSSALHAEWEGAVSGLIYRRVDADRLPRAGEIRVATITSFRGLESPVVILVETDRMRGFVGRDPNELAYLALTRCAQHLIVIGELPEPVVTLRNLRDALLERLSLPTGFPVDLRARAETLAQQADRLLAKAEHAQTPSFGTASDDELPELDKRRAAIRRLEEEIRRILRHPASVVGKNGDT